MSDKSSVLRGFNVHFFDFLNDISNIIPENDDIVSSKLFFETVKKANPTIIIKCWYSYVYMPYKDVIDSGNVDYFLEKDYNKDVSSFKNSEEIVKGIDKIREPIKNMSEINQQHSMKYIQNLSKLSFIYHNGG